MKMLYATLLSLLIASVSAQSQVVTISSALDRGSKCLEVKEIDRIKNGTAVEMLVYFDCITVTMNNGWNFKSLATIVMILTHSDGRFIIREARMHRSDWETQN